VKRAVLPLKRHHGKREHLAEAIDAVASLACDRAAMR
jgi:hypothetical protein